ncbi:cuticle protein 14-like [Tachypleus tridentatus]|uniref:cuticle protein 14-like n=1 Tax=Tachypleus tridentatus TaxID=6853 RepID=UPI003FD40AFF
MKVLIVLAVIATAHAGYFYHPAYYYGAGGSTQFKTQDNIGNYNFGYNEGHATGGTFRRETGDAFGNVKIGSYGLTDADGRRRIVNYKADATGFTANVHTNEPGTDSSKDPANTLINKALLPSTYYGGYYPGHYYGGYYPGHYYGGYYPGHYYGHHGYY